MHKKIIIALLMSCNSVLLNAQSLWYNRLKHSISNHPMLTISIGLGMLGTASYTLYKKACARKPVDPHLTDNTYTIGKTTIKVVKGDITHQKVDVIVNAANKELLAGGGVCGAIFDAAGLTSLQNACNAITRKNGIACPVGQARITPSFDLEKRGIRYIIHAVGPDCRIITDTNQRKELLSGSYVSSLKLAQQEGLTSIAFPFISASIYACPKDLAATTALDSVITFLSKQPNSSIKEVRFVLFTNEDYRIFTNTLAHYKHSELVGQHNFLRDEQA